jgi:hypothetical protein
MRVIDFLTDAATKPVVIKGTTIDNETGLPQSNVPNPITQSARP